MAPVTRSKRKPETAAPLSPRKLRPRKKARVVEPPIVKEVAVLSLPIPYTSPVVAADALVIRASATRNYLLRDPLLDWLKEHAAGDARLSTPLSNEHNFTDFIMAQGTEFEQRVALLLQGKFGTDFVNIGTTGSNVDDPRYEAATIAAIRKGTPLIYQGVLFHQPSRTGGIPDLLVRSDYLAQLVEHNPLSSEKAVRRAGRLVTGSYHYVVVDIKYATLNLRADGTHLLNAGSVPAYKGQLFIYQRALAALQQYDPEASYLLGRRWIYTTHGERYEGGSCFGRLGSINYTTIDRAVPQLVDEAVAWVRAVRTEGAGWDILNPHRIELYPNMSNAADWPWTRVKKELVEQVGDLTKLWMCGAKARAIGHANGIRRYDDPRLTAELLGIKGEYTSRILNRILEVNAPACKEVILSAELNLPPVELELYVDFEGLSSAMEDFVDLPLAGGSNGIFMIGVGHVDPSTKQWIYRDFTAHHLGRDEEQRIAREFVAYLATFPQKLGLLHWSHYEASQWGHILDDSADLFEAWCALNAQWIDLLRAFKEKPVVVKGAYGFGLKEIVRALHKHGLIQTSYAASTVVDGSDAMVTALRASRRARAEGVSMTTTEEMKAIRAYNEIDCKVLAEVLSVVRDANAF